MNIFQEDSDLDDLYEQAPCGYFSALPNNVIIRINATFLAWLGYEREELLGKIEWDKLLTMGGQIFHQTHLTPLILTKDFIEEINFDFKKKNGDKLPILLNIKSKKDPSGKIILLRFVVLQFKQRKSYEQEILKMKEKAQAANSAKSEFLASTSHEIRTPLNAIIGFTDLLQKTTLNETQAEYIRIVNDSANSLMNLLNDILDFSKIEAGKLELSLERVDLPKLVESVVDLIKYEIFKKKLDLIVSISPDIPRFISIDPTRLMQILINLLGNALKFTAEGEIEVKLESNINNSLGNEVILFFSVRDSGIGISEENRSKIFEAFSQEDSTTTRKYGGTGLGLSISNKLLELMDSKLELKSELGKGSEFYFSIKAVIENNDDSFEVSQLTKTSGKDTSIFLNKFKVLIVDDNESNRFLVRRILSKILPEGTIAEAHNGKEATLACIKELPDLIFMDAHMPEMNGYEAALAIRKIENGNKIIIIALTAGTAKEEIEKCFQSGMNDFISKPVNVDTFKSILTKWL